MSLFETTKNLLKTTDPSAKLGGLEENTSAVRHFCDVAFRLPMRSLPGKTWTREYRLRTCTSNLAYSIATSGRAAYLRTARWAATQSTRLAVGALSLALGMSIVPASAQAAALTNTSMCSYTYYLASWTSDYPAAGYYWSSEHMVLSHNGGVVSGQGKLHYPGQILAGGTEFRIPTGYYGAVYIAFWSWDGAQWIPAGSKWISRTAATVDADGVWCGPGL